MATPARAPMTSTARAASSATTPRRRASWARSTAPGFWARAGDRRRPVARTMSPGVSVVGAHSQIWPAAVRSTAASPAAPWVVGPLDGADHVVELGVVEARLERWRDRRAQLERRGGGAEAEHQRGAGQHRLPQRARQGHQEHARHQPGRCRHARAEPTREVAAERQRDRPQPPSRVRRHGAPVVQSRPRLCARPSDDRGGASAAQKRAPRLLPAREPTYDRAP
jgi:hypothetical protein